MVAALIIPYTNIMLQIVIIALFSVQSFAGNAIFSRPSRPAKVVKNCKEAYEALQPDYGTIFQTSSLGIPIRLAQEPFGANAARFAEVFEPTLRIAHPEQPLANRRPDPLNYERRLREFANERGDNRSATKEVSDSNGLKTHIKMNTSTGELLITNSKNEVGLYMRLPVFDRPLGHFKTTGEILDDLSNWVSMPIGDSQQRQYKIWPRITSGESIKTEGFGTEKLWPHFEKHVLNKFSNESRENYLQDITDPKTKWMRRTAEFPKLREEYVNESVKLQANETSKITELNAAVAQKYNQAAIDFCKSSEPHLLTITRIQKLPNGTNTVVAYRFNPLTNEFAVLNRLTGRILTYYVVNSDMKISNSQLSFNWKLPPVKTPTEYFIAMGTRPIDSFDY